MVPPRSPRVAVEQDANSFVVPLVAESSLANPIRGLAQTMVPLVYPAIRCDPSDKVFQTLWQCLIAGLHSSRPAYDKPSRNGRP
jgi:hypothetical protein